MAGEVLRVGGAVQSVTDRNSKMGGYGALRVGGENSVAPGAMLRLPQTLPTLNTNSALPLVTALDHCRTLSDPRRELKVWWQDQWL